MGWTGYRADHYTKAGAVDRKAECDAYFMEGLNRGHFFVEKSTMVGSTYYAAVRTLKRGVLDENGKHKKDADGRYLYEDIPEGEQKVWAAVFLTSTEKADGCNFFYKNMDETVGPCQYDCPESILKLLSPTDNEYAKEWRNKCLLHTQAQKIIKDCPIGTVLEFHTGSGETMSIRKRMAAYQFKKPWWYCDEKDCYIRPAQIPDNFLVNGEKWQVKPLENASTVFEEQMEQMTLDLEEEER